MAIKSKVAKGGLHMILALCLRKERPERRIRQ